MTAIEKEIGEFFSGYAEAWNASDAEVLRAFFAIPTLIATKRSTTFYESGAELLAHLEMLIQSYAAQGVIQRTVSNCAARLIADDAVHAKLKWRLAGIGNRALLVTPTSYTLSRDGGHWGIIAIDLRPERAELAAQHG